MIMGPPNGILKLSNRKSGKSPNIDSSNDNTKHLSEALIQDIINEVVRATTDPHNNRQDVPDVGNMPDILMDNHLGKTKVLVTKANKIARPPALGIGFLLMRLALGLSTAQTQGQERTKGSPQWRSRSQSKRIYS